MEGKRELIDHTLGRSEPTDRSKKIGRPLHAEPRGSAVQVRTRHMESSHASKCRVPYGIVQNAT